MIIKHIDQNTAVKIAAAYLKEWKDWKLVSLRGTNDPTAANDPTHCQALYELAERENIIKHIKQAQPVTGEILEWRFIKRYQVKRCLDLLDKQQHSISERTFRNYQRQGLLTVYNLRPDNETRLIKPAE